MRVCASVCRLHDAAQRLGSPLQCPCHVVLEPQLVAAPFRSNNNRQNVAARNSRCQALATRERFGYCDASTVIATDGAPLSEHTSPPESCHDKCPATGEVQPHQQCSVSRRPVPTNNSGGLARIFQSPRGLEGCCSARYLVAPLPVNMNVPSVDKTT